MQAQRINSQISVGKKYENRYNSKRISESGKGYGSRHASKSRGLSREDKKVLLAALLLVTVFGVTMVIASAVSADIAYKNNEIKLANKELESEIQTIELNIEYSDNLGRIEKTAMTKLGMNFPEENQFVEINPDVQMKKNEVAKENL